MTTPDGQPALALLSDEELLSLCLDRRDRDDRPYGELLRRHWEAIWSLCYRFLQNRQDAEDIAQEVFVKAYRGLTEFDGRSSLRTWLHRIAVTSCLNEQRRQSRRPSLSAAPLEWLEGGLGGESPEDRWLEQIVQREWLEALAELSEGEREALLLREVEELSYAEIAERLAISLSAAKMRVQRARVVWRQRLAARLGR